MRKLLMTILLATTVAMPAMAQEVARHQDEASHEASREPRDEVRATRRAERAERVEARRAERPRRFEREVQQLERPERADREAQQFERPRRVERQTQQVDQLRVTTSNHSDNQPSSAHGEYHRDARRDHRDLHASDPSRREHRVYHRDQTRDHRTGHRSWERDSRRAGHGEYHRDANREHEGLHASDPTRREHREGHRDLTRQHDRRHAAWNSSWRSNRSYDWRGYRSRYGSLYNLSNYYDPYRNGYRRFSIGFNLWPSYYNSRYWLNDPWQYRLPPAYGPYRWVRYYNDALLVNVYTGQVVDAIHSFFW